MLSFAMLILVVLSVVLLNAVMLCDFAQERCAECRFTECSSVEGHGTTQWVCSTQEIALLSQEISGQFY
jgi:hypothetical protein